MHDLTWMHSAVQKRVQEEEEAMLATPRQELTNSTIDYLDSPLVSAFTLTRWILLLGGE
jgi:hypothetical protein